MSRNDQRPMSIDAMLDMERQEVLALLESKKQVGAPPDMGGMRSSSPFATVPRSPVRSMLDIDEEECHDLRTTPAPQAPVRSMLDVDGFAAPRQPPVRSMLDPMDAPRAKAQHRSSSPITPVDSRFASTHAGGGGLHPRSLSDAGHKSMEFGPRSGKRNDRTSEYQFSGILSHSGGAGVPKRASSSNKRLPGNHSLGEALRATDLSSMQLQGDRGRHSPLGGRLGGPKSKSPHDKWETRSRSPATFSPSRLPKNKAMLDDGQLVDISSAYRRLSDANLAFSSGSLAQLPMRKRSEEIGEGRLVKDYLGPDGEHLESSEEDDPYTSDDEDRGRKTAPRSLNPGAREDGGGSKSRSRSGQGGRKSLSLLAAAEQERKCPF